ncbi:hypothetical protein CMI47_16265 [Candidatus Pacearchaeota archaeon]|nr:hypothetical protein [Candidatus Pacearchaeota archaeon]|tara:strand:+ start:4670 stop:5029 length:360 start_codon:yes stop_codon:yes gene_type:complete
MSEKKKPTIYTFDETAAKRMLTVAESEIGMLIDLLENKLQEDIFNPRVFALLCDCFSSNYHIKRIIKINLDLNFMEDKEKKENFIAMNETDLLLVENAVLARIFTKAELLRSNCSLSFH